MSELKWTGERFLPEVDGNVKIEHMHRYQIALNFAQGKKVLDIACGEGYGSNLLAKAASSVIGVDVAYEAILHAKKKYSCNNIRFIQGDCAAIPISNNYIDLVVSFETIEHHARHKEFILEIKRVLKKDGLLIISSPDKKEYTDFVGYINEYHLKELYYSEFEQLIKENFKHFSILGQRIKFGSYITPLKKEDNVNSIYYKDNSNGLIEEKNSIFAPLYFIALASDEKITQNFSSLYEHPIENSELVTTLSNSLKSKINECNKVTDERDTAITECNQLIAELDQADAFIMTILDSTSWYITKPVRWLKGKLIVLSDLNVMNSMKNFNNAIQSSGGVKSVLINTIRLLRNGGFNDKKNLVKHFFPMFKKSKSVINSNIPATPVDNTSFFEHGSCVNYDKSNFVDYNACSKINTDIRAIAFFLPQFHPIPENDKWWGKGFTEWTNVTKAKPQFIGHYQPHLPGELGFYDLRLVDVQKQQVELAKKYGIYGFCFHYYWFSGRRLLERPINQFLANKKLDFPFCFCWANENWTRRWDGLYNEILIAQFNKKEDDIAFIKDLELALKDSRYIKVDGKPLLIVYRVSLLPNPVKTVKLWRNYCIEAGIGDLYLVAAQTFGLIDPKPYGFDAAVEFPPHNEIDEPINDKKVFLNAGFEGEIYNYKNLVQRKTYTAKPDFEHYPTVFPSWDNEARRPGKGHVFWGSSPDLYQKWFESACNYADANNNLDKKLVFINAWNEWAEGAHIEPDQRYGYAYLEATANVLRQFPATEKQTLVSVVMPVYNHDRFIEQAMQSVCSQTYENIELIVVNDGSIDASEDVIQRFVGKHPNCKIRAVKQDNAGSAAAIQRGIDIATGEYIALINSDDVYEPTRIECILRTMKDEGAELGFSGVSLIDDDDMPCAANNTTAKALQKKLDGVNRFPNIIYALLDSNVAVSTGNLIFTRRLYNDIGGFNDLKLCHDWDFMLQAVCRTKATYIEKQLYKYRIHSSNTFEELTDLAIDDTKTTLMRFFDSLQNHPQPCLKMDSMYFKKFIKTRGYKKYMSIDRA